jgi:hypothetical protein
VTSVVVTFTASPRLNADSPAGPCPGFTLWKVLVSTRPLVPAAERSGDLGAQIRRWEGLRLAAALDPPGWLGDILTLSSGARAP